MDISDGLQDYGADKSEDPSTIGESPSNAQPSVKPKRNTVTPEQREKILTRARKLSGTILAYTEQIQSDSSEEDTINTYDLRNRRLTKSEEDKSQTRKTPNTRRHKVQNAAQTCHDIRTFTENTNAVNAFALMQTQTVKGDTNISKKIKANLQKVSIVDRRKTIQHSTPATDTQVTMSNKGSGNTMTKSKSVDAEVSNNAILLQIQQNHQKILDALTSHKEEIKKSLEETTAKITTLENQNTEVREKVDVLEFNDKDKDERITKLEETVALLTQKMTSMSDTIIRQDAIIQEIGNKQTTFEEKQLSSNIVIYNVDEVENETVMLTTVNFFRDILNAKIAIYITKAYRLGKKKAGTTRPILVVLHNSDEKKKIFDNIKNLKGKKNNAGEKYRIKTQKPAKLQEADTRKKDIVYRDKKRTTAHNLEMSLKKGILTYKEDNTTKEYHQLIHPPSAKTILEMDREDRERTMKTPIKQGNTIHKENCRFIGYTMCTDRIGNIRDGYNKLRIIHGSARHIVCAFRIPHPVEAQYQDYTDDDEYYAGKKLLEMLRDAEIFFRVVYVVRYYGGKNLGGDRFKGYLEAAQSAINMAPYNNISKQTQTPYPAVSHTGKPEKTNNLQEEIEAEVEGTGQQSTQTFRKEAPSPPTNTLLYSQVAQSPPASVKTFTGHIQQLTQQIQA